LKKLNIKTVVKALFSVSCDNAVSATTTTTLDGTGLHVRCKRQHQQGEMVLARVLFEDGEYQQRRPLGLGPPHHRHGNK
jgi:hypothetical protein